MVEREKRCEGNIKEMERLLYIMKREKEDIADERSKLEDLISFGQLKKNNTNNNNVKNADNSNSMSDKYGSRWNQLIFGATLEDNKESSGHYNYHMTGECEDVDSSEKEVDIDTEDSMKSFDHNIAILSSV